MLKNFVVIVFFVLGSLKERDRDADDNVDLKLILNRFSFESRDTLKSFTCVVCHCQGYHETESRTHVHR